MVSLWGPPCGYKVVGAKYKKQNHILHEVGPEVVLGVPDEVPVMLGHRHNTKNQLPAKIRSLGVPVASCDLERVADQHYHEGTVQGVPPNHVQLPQGDHAHSSDDVHSRPLSSGGKRLAAAASLVWHVRQLVLLDQQLQEVQGGLAGCEAPWPAEHGPM